MIAALSVSGCSTTPTRLDAGQRAGIEEFVRGTVDGADAIVAAEVRGPRIVGSIAPDSAPDDTCGYAFVVSDLVVSESFRGLFRPGQHVEVASFIECPVALAALAGPKLLFLVRADSPDAPARWLTIENSTIDATEELRAITSQVLATG
jgi:hypothetical protein